MKTPPDPDSTTKAPLLLPTALRRNGFDLTLVKREGSLAIYRQTRPGQSWERFEVIRIRIERERTFPNGHTTPAHEAYPCSEACGTDGFTCTTEERACQKLADMSV